MCERAQVRVRAGRRRGLTWELGREKSTTRSGHQSGQKSSPVKGGRGLLGAARPRPARTPATAPFPPGPWGVRAAPLRLRGARPTSLGLRRRAVSAALGGGGRGEAFRGPAARGRSCRWRGRKVASRPLGAGSAVFGGRCAFCFVLILSEVASSAGGRARGARGSASDTCEEAATACGARAPGRAGRAKVQV